MVGSAGLAALCFSFASDPKVPAKPNFVFFFADDLTYRALHYMGNEQVRTPNLDRLAARGANFTHSYNMGGWNGAICTASRSMLVSGMSVWHVNQHREKWSAGDAAALNTTWPKLLEKAGYDTYMTGKWHVDASASKIFGRAEHIRAGMPKDTYSSPEAQAAFAQARAGELTWAEAMPNGYNRPLSVDDKSWSPTDSSKGGFWEGGKHWTEVVADDAADFARQASQSERPFFMYLAFNAAHDPRQSPQEFIDMYPLKDIKIPKSFQPDYPFHDEIGVGPKLRDEALAPFPRTELAIKTHLQEYYAIISHLDAQIGKILDDLEAKGLLENTYIFFAADHGLAVGMHGLLGKQSMYDHSLRTPLLMAGPGVPAGKTVTQDVYYQDIMPTTLELAGIAKPGFVEFKSLLPLAKGTQKGKSYEAVYGAYVNLQRMVRQDGFKLIVYPKANKFLLFDLKKDPEEMNNLADQPGFQGKKKTLFAELTRLQKQYDDKLDLSAMRP
ncbi:choline-sulfatase [Persicitalea jodogahamensis]|uniref:Choline-sulfatase n=2 Tax=Persicitalea jodogahamensis TaxID=402147 RepID=A0A8J3G8Q2_9BACT|nr:choline-sulfatase [Persicitalea jodogahamensis]